MFINHQTLQSNTRQAIPLLSETFNIPLSSPVPHLLLRSSQLPSRAGGALTRSFPSSLEGGERFPQPPALRRDY